MLTLLIIIGSRGFHWFDAALIGYAVATIFATAAVTYKYTFWLARLPDGIGGVVGNCFSRLRIFIGTPC